MAKNIMQYRFYRNGSPKNQPLGVEEDAFTSGAVFAEKIPITQLGIQALPGTAFFINNGLDPIFVGNTGIYELELNSGAVITALRFDSASVGLVNSMDSSYIIVDTVYEEGD